MHFACALTYIVSFISIISSELCNYNGCLDWLWKSRTWSQCGGLIIECGGPLIYGTLVNIMHNVNMINNLRQWFAMGILRHRKTLQRFILFYFILFIYGYHVVKRLRLRIQWFCFDAWEHYIQLAYCHTSMLRTREKLWNILRPIRVKHVPFSFD